MSHHPCSDFFTMRFHCRKLVLLLFIQIAIVVWYFNRKKDPPSSSVLTRLGRDGAEFQPGDGILHIKELPSSELFYWYDKDNVCVKEGLELDSVNNNGNKCVCRKRWGGKRCGLPQAVINRSWMSDPLLVKRLQVRKRPRRLILFVSDFFYDFYLFELNMRLLSDLVDVVVVGEVTTGYHSRNETLVSQFERGFLKEYHDRIVYVEISDRRVSNTLDKLHYTVDKGLRIMSDLRIDDILIFTTAENIIRRDFALFLKLFHNYPQPIQCHNEEYVYNFGWKVESKASFKSEAPLIHFNDTSKQNSLPTAKELVFSNLKMATLYGEEVIQKPKSEMPSICAISVHLFSMVFRNQVDLLDQAPYLLYTPQNLAFYESLEMPLFPWTFRPSGWKCHLCVLSSDTIYRKLSALPWNNRPKWFKSSSFAYNDMLAYIDKIKESGKDENLVQAVKTNVDKLGNNKFDPFLDSFNIDFHSFMKNRQNKQRS